MGENLISRYQETSDRAILEDLINQYVYLVKTQADKLVRGVPPGVYRDDLISFGVIGLIDSFNKFDVSKNVPFEAYARIRIRGAMIDGLRQFDFVPRRLRDQVKQLQRQYQELEKKLGRSPSNEELATYMDKQVTDIDKLWQDAAAVIPLYLSDFILNEDEELKFEDVYPDPTSPEPLHNLLESQGREELATAIDQLPEKERVVLSLYYYEELTLREIAGVLELTESRISQIHSKAITKLRSKLLRVQNET